MNTYVLGFLFNDKKQVWLIRKTKPEWQKGKLNGIGGKVEMGEDCVAAMIREFKEETGLTITNWDKFCTLSDGLKYQIICYVANSNEIPQTTTDEVVGLYDSKNLPDDVLFNSYWLIPMAATGYRYRVTECFEIKNHDERETTVVEQEELCKHNIPIDEICDECAEDMGLRSCEQCDEIAWDGRICYACGAKDI